MTYAEIVVNVPIRRTFARRFAEGPPLSDEDGPPGAVEPQAEDAPSLQAFHYSLPPQLEGVVQPGHLVWAPFGAREVQGFVLRLSDVRLWRRAVLRLAGTGADASAARVAADGGVLHRRAGRNAWLFRRPVC